MVSNSYGMHAMLSLASAECCEVYYVSVVWSHPIYICTSAVAVLKRM